MSSPAGFSCCSGLTRRTLQCCGWVLVSLFLAGVLNWVSLGITSPRDWLRRNRENCSRADPGTRLGWVKQRSNS